MFLKVSCVLFALLCLANLNNVQSRHLPARLKALLLSYHRDEYSPDEADLQPKITSNDLPKNGEMFEGDIVMNDVIRDAVLGRSSKKSAVIDAEAGHQMHWKKGRVPYVFADDVLPVIKDRILDAIEEFNELTCIRYVKKTDEDEDYAIFTSKRRGCSSSVGRQGGPQKINLGSGCKRIGTVLHEMMHTIGFIHEQSRSDRDNFIKVDFRNIKDDMIHNFRKYTLEESDNQDIPYNYFSVMHYSNYAFSMNDKPTLLSRVDKRLKFGQRIQLTPLDVEQINRAYGWCHPHKLKASQKDELIEDMTPQKAKQEKDARDEAFDMVMNERYD